MNRDSKQPALVERMREIEAALVRALEARGHACSAGVALVGERLAFRCYEPRRGSVYAPTGSGRPVLTARPLDHHGGGERRWMDKAQPLEGQLGRIVLRFEAIARAVKENRASSEAHHRETEAAMRSAAGRLLRDRRRAARGEQLQEMAEDWRRAERLRAFLEAARARLGPAPSPAMAAWLAWASAHVDDLDPLSPARLAELEGQEIELQAPEGEPHPHEEEWRAEGLLESYLEHLA